MPYECTRINAGNPDDTLCTHFVVEGRISTVITHAWAGGTDHKPREPIFAAFVICIIDTRVPDVGRGHDDNLVVVRRVRQDFLVAGHRRVEDYFTGTLPDGAECTAGPYGAVFECQHGWCT